MRFDDRLLTVLQSRVAGEQSARTQFRQLLDILGRRESLHSPASRTSGPDLALVAKHRLDELNKSIALRDRVSVLSQAPLRAPDLVEWFAQQEPDLASAALWKAALPEQEWLNLIPDLPVRARGFLRGRGDLPAEVRRLLDDLGVQDRGLPRPAGSPEAIAAHSETAPTSEPASRPLPPAALPAQDGIAELVQRIEAFKKRRPDSDLRPSPSLSTKTLDVFDFTANGAGEIDSVDGDAAPAIVGTHLAQDGPLLRQGVGRMLEQRLPLRGTRIELNGSPVVSGTWRVDAMPAFSKDSGRFERYVGRARRVAGAADPTATRSNADRVRQLLHELRTPVTAIQGFAEVIQQQVFGETPHGYRALAAAIAGDSATMLAGFDEIDRLVRLESGALEFEQGECEFTSVLVRQLEQVSTVLVARVSKLEFDRPENCIVAMSEADAERLAWRFVAAVASVMTAGEDIALTLQKEAGIAVLSCRLPDKLATLDDIFSADVRPGTGALSASLFGTGFALRVARAEAEAAGGSLTVKDGAVRLALPAITDNPAKPAITLSDIARRTRNA